MNFSLGRKISNPNATQRRLFWLILGIGTNLGILGYYKYANFILENITTVLGSKYSIGAILLPLAISFFTFQQIAYLVDCYQGKAKEYGFINYCLFVTFFPQLIAGPIVHHKEMMPQFEKVVKAKYEFENLTRGVFIFIIGLFKKVVVADNFAIISDRIFMYADTGNSVVFIDAWIGALCYTFQLYFDFSGYTDMAIGASLLFGISLPLNFNSPYRARNIMEFWRRWHMTLSRFLRDYL